jgi:hypothetical protein
MTNDKRKKIITSPNEQYQDSILQSLSLLETKILILQDSITSISKSSSKIINVLNTINSILEDKQIYSKKEFKDQFSKIIKQTEMAEKMLLHQIKESENILKNEILMESDISANA